MKLARKRISTEFEKFKFDNFRNTLTSLYGISSTKIIWRYQSYLETYCRDDTYSHCLSGSYRNR